MTETATAHAEPAEPDISPVPDASGHFVVGAVAVAEEGGAARHQASPTAAGLRPRR